MSELQRKLAQRRSINGEENEHGNPNFIFTSIINESTKSNDKKSPRSGDDNGVRKTSSNELHSHKATVTINVDHTEDEKMKPTLLSHELHSKLSRRLAINGESEDVISPHKMITVDDEITKAPAHRLSYRHVDDPVMDAELQRHIDHHKVQQEKQEVKAERHEHDFDGNLAALLQMLSSPPGSTPIPSETNPESLNEVAKVLDLEPESKPVEPVEGNEDTSFAENIAIISSKFGAIPLESKPTKQSLYTTASTESMMSQYPLNLMPLQDILAKEGQENAISFYLKEFYSPEGVVESVDVSPLLSPSKESNEMDIKTIDSANEINIKPSLSTRKSISLNIASSIPVSPKKTEDVKYSPNTEALIAPLSITDFIQVNSSSTDINESTSTDDAGRTPVLLDMKVVKEQRADIENNKISSSPIDEIEENEGKTDIRVVEAPKTDVKPTTATKAKSLKHSIFFDRSIIDMKAATNNTSDYGMYDGSRVAPIPEVSTPIISNTVDVFQVPVVQSSSSVKSDESSGKFEYPIVSSPEISPAVDAGHTAKKIPGVSTKASEYAIALSYHDLLATPPPPPSTKKDVVANQDPINSPAKSSDEFGFPVVASPEYSPLRTADPPKTITKTNSRISPKFVNSEQVVNIVNDIESEVHESLTPKSDEAVKGSVIAEVSSVDSNSVSSPPTNSNSVSDNTPSSTSPVRSTIVEVQSPKDSTASSEFDYPQVSSAELSPIDKNCDAKLLDNKEIATGKSESEVPLSYNDLLDIMKEINPNRQNTIDSTSVFSDITEKVTEDLAQTSSVSHSIQSPHVKSSPENSSIQGNALVSAQSIAIQEERSSPDNSFIAYQTTTTTKTVVTKTTIVASNNVNSIEELVAVYENHDSSQQALHIETSNLTENRSNKLLEANHYDSSNSLSTNDSQEENVSTPVDTGSNGISCIIFGFDWNIFNVKCNK